MEEAGKLERSVQAEEALGISDPGPIPAENGTQNLKVKPGSSFFQRELGITDLSPVVRKGMRCYHCDGELPKHSMKFVYAFKRTKPTRSLHPSCIAQILPEAIPNSIRFLESAMIQDGRSQIEKNICKDTLDVLKAMPSAAR